MPRAHPSRSSGQDKQREFGQLKFEYTLLRARWGGHAGYDAWFARPLNNAHLAAVATYHDCVPGLQRELEAAGSLAAFYARAEDLASLPHASGMRRCVATLTSDGGWPAERAGFESLHVIRLVETGALRRPDPLRLSELPARRRPLARRTIAPPNSAVGAAGAVAADR